MFILVQEVHRTPNMQNQKRNPLWCIIVKILKSNNKEWALKTSREKNQVTYKDRPNRITVDYFIETF